MEQKNTTLRFVLSRVLLFVLIAVIALAAVSCGGETNTETQAGTESETALAKTFTFEVVTLDGETKTFTISTEHETVGDALLEEGLIEGENGAYGLYVKKVTGILADYDVDGTYWSFYANGEYAMSGVDTTPVEDGATYSFKVAK